MRIAVIGAAGFIGNALAKMAIREGHEVFCYSRSGFKPHPAAIACICNLANGQIELPKKPDAVYYLAQSRHYRQFPEYADDLFAVNAQGAAIAANAARRAGCRFFLYASSGSVYAPSFDPLAEDSPAAAKTAYAASKLMGEMAAASFKDYMTVINARIFGVYGPGRKNMLPQILLNKIREHKAVELEPGPCGKDGGLKISFIYIEDMCKILLELAKMAISVVNIPEVLNIAGPFAVSIAEFAKTLADCLDMQARFSFLTIPRKTDLAADIALLRDLCSPVFTSLEDGVKLMVSDQQII